MQTRKKIFLKRPRLLPRQRLLIGLLEAVANPIPNRQFQKLLFLYCQQNDPNGPYEFVPYRFGAFSFTSYSDRRKLIERGLLVDESLSWQLTPNGRRCAVLSRYPDMATFVNRFGMLKGDSLVAETYRRYPYYAIRSEIANKVLRGDRDTLRRIDDARPLPNPNTLATIGYEARSLESYLNILLQAGVTLLCDVRRNAVSRKYGFAKSTLENACVGVGIRYRHLPELGISSESRRNLKGQAEYSRLFKQYENHELPRNENALKKITQWIKSGECVALTCYEQNPSHCHRSRVAKELYRQISSLLPVLHL